MTWPFLLKIMFGGEPNRFKGEEFQILFASHNFSPMPLDNLSKFSNYNETKTDFISVSRSVEVVKYQ